MLPCKEGCELDGANFRIPTLERGLTPSFSSVKLSVSCAGLVVLERWRDQVFTSGYGRRSRFEHMDDTPSIAIVDDDRGVKVFRPIATGLRDVVCVMTRMDGSAAFSG